METKLRYFPPAVSPERALRVFTEPERNPGIPLDLDLVRALRINRSAVERRAATIPTRRTVKKEWQAAWLLRAITCMDLTTLQGDDTPTNVLRLCAKAQHPLRRDILEALGAAPPAGPGAPGGGASRGAQCACAPVWGGARAGGGGGGGGAARGSPWPR